MNSLGKCSPKNMSLKSRKAVISIAPPGTLIAFTFRSLGYFVCTSRRVGRKLANSRCDSALATMRQIRFMPNPHHEKLIFAELCSLTKLTFGSEITLPSERNLHTLRTATINTLWKMQRCAREPNIIFILILKPHKYEPHMALSGMPFELCAK